MSSKFQNLNRRGWSSAHTPLCVLQDGALRDGKDTLWRKAWPEGEHEIHKAGSEKEDFEGKRRLLEGTFFPFGDLPLGH